MRVAYLVSRFPKLSETFIVDEILALERCGVEIDLYAFVRERRSPARDARALADRCWITPVWSPWPWLAQLSWLVRAPKTLLSVWARVVYAHRRSARLLARSVAAVVLAAHHALRMQRCGVEHVHAHWATHPALGAWVIHQLTGLPYSFTAHADDLFVNQILLAEKAKRAAFVVTISEYNRRYLAEQLGAAAPRIEVVHCGVATSALDPAPETAGAPFRIACVARLEEKKGHVLLVDACAQLVHRGVDVRCDLVGDGRKRSALAERIDGHGLADRVALHGAQSHAYALECIAHATAIALPSLVTATGRRDGIPVALMEAMALGRPVVASAVSGIPELVEHERSGLLVPPGDAVALADALARLAADPSLRRRLGAAARRRVAEAFDVDRSAERLCALFAAQARRLAPVPPLEARPLGEVSR